LNAPTHMDGNEMSAKLKNQQGAALLAVLVVSTVLALVGTSYLSTSTHEAGLITEQIQEAQALYAAESGIEYARRRLKTWNEWTDWSETINTPQVDGVGGSATVSFTYDDVNEIGTITSTSTFLGNQKQIVVSVTPIKETPFQQATCGCTSINLNGAGTVDSYDGSVMTYEDPSNPVTNSGDVVSNGDVDLGGATILGDIVAGGNLSGNNSSNVSGSATLGGNAAAMSGTVNNGITSNVTPVPSPCDCNAIDIDTEVAQAAASNNNSLIDPAYLTGTDFNIQGQVTTTIPAGTYYFTSFQTGGDASININGQVIIFFSGSGPFKFTGQGIFNPTNNTGNLRIYSNSTAEIDLQGSSQFAGTIYAPRAPISLSGQTEVYGSLIGQVSIMNGAVGLHYDTSIPAQGEPEEIEVSTVTVQTNSWSQI